MDQFKVKAKRKPETLLQKKMCLYLRARQWYVKEMHASLFLAGVPDLYCCHSKYGPRWIELKILETGRYTPAQLEEFPKMAANGAGIWVLTADTDEEYMKLFRPCNWLLFTEMFRAGRKV
jgi:hypothetical protein